VMKKVLVITLVLVLLSLTSVFAYRTRSFPDAPEININLLQRDSDGNQMNPNVNGWVHMKYGDRIETRGMSLKKYTFYTLVYADSDDEEIYVNCIDKRKTNNLGDLKIKNTEFYYLDLLEDKDNVFMIVLSSDVDCKKHKMIAWNPNKYLFPDSII